MTLISAIAGLALLQPQTDVSKLAFLTGSYIGQKDSVTTQLTWLSIEGGSISGVMQTTVVGPPTVSYMTVSTTKDGTYMFLTTGQPDKGLETRPLKLVKTDSMFARFEGIGNPNIKSIEFSRLNDNSLKIVYQLGKVKPASESETDHGTDVQVLVLKPKRI